MFGKSFAGWSWEACPTRSYSGAAGTREMDGAVRKILYRVHVSINIFIMITPHLQALIALAEGRDLFVTPTCDHALARMRPKKATGGRSRYSVSYLPHHLHTNISCYSTRAPFQ